MSSLNVQGVSLYSSRSSTIAYENGIHMNAPYGSLPCDDISAISDERPPPVERLPPDVLVNIFIHCLQKRAASNTTGAAPLLLCEVCSSWRTLALQTPRLWSTLCIEPCIRLKIRVTTYAQHLHAWIALSASLPLKLRLRFKGLVYPWKNGIPLLYAVMKVFLQYTPRWRSVKISISFTTSTELNFQFPGHISAPLARTLEIEGQDGFHPHSPVFTLPAVTKLSWTPLCRTFPSMAISWHLLTAVRVRVGYAFSTALEIIERCPKLVNFIVDFTERDIGTPVELPPGEPIVNHNLHVFSVTFSSSCKHLFDRLALPGLQRFVLINEDDYVLDTPELVHPYREEMLNLFSRSQCRLKDLVLSEPGFDPSPLLYHASCQTIQRLGIKIHGRPFDSATLFRLMDIPGRPESTLLPWLKHIYLDYSEGMEPGMLGALALSRRQPTAREQLTLLAVTILDDYPDLGMEDTVVLQKLQREGLMVNYGRHDNFLR